MKKLAMGLMMLSLGLFSVGCDQAADDASAPVTPAAGAPGAPGAEAAHDHAEGEADHADDAPAEN